MLITFTHKGKNIPCECLEYAKLYSVPKAYSDDGYAVMTWENGVAEPVPACLGSDTKMLCHVKADADKGAVETITANDGVICNA